MGFSVLRRGLGFCRSAGLLTSRTHCSFSGGLISEKVATNPSPWLMLPPRSFDDDSGTGTGKAAFNFHRLGYKEPIAFEKLALPAKLDELYFAGSSHGWLLVHNWVNRDAFLLNPITGRHIKLPPVRAQGGVKRVALSCSPDDTEECRAMIIYGRSRKLALCVPGRSTEWTPIGEGEGESESKIYEDVAYSSIHKLFFCFCTTSAGYRYASEVEGWDVGEPLCPRIDSRLQNNELKLFGERNYLWPYRTDPEWELKMVCWHIKYMLVYAHDLYVVVRHVNPRMGQYDLDGRPAVTPLYISKYRGWEASIRYETFEFDVFKIDWRDSNVRYMECSLEGLAMFVGNNQSFALSSTSTSTELKPNCIYFSDDNNLMRKSRSFVDNEFGGHDNGIYDYQNNTFSNCCSGAEDCPLYREPDYVSYDVKRIEPSPMWFAHY